MTRPIFFFPLLFLLFSGRIAFSQNDVVFIDGPAFICEGDCAQLTAVTPPTMSTPLSYAWSNGDQLRTITVCAAGTYSVTVTSGNGLAYTASFLLQELPYLPIQILSTNANLCPDTISQCERVCPNTTVTYYLSGTGSTPGGGPAKDSTLWSVQGSVDFSISPDGRSITINWGQPGNGSVSVIAISPAGCVGETSVCVNIVESPQAAFATVPAAPADTLEVCAGQLVSFQNSSLYADIFQWYFDDDNSVSDVPNPDHPYNTPGVYSITLVAQSACSCADTAVLPVRVLPTEPFELDCIGTICPGEVVTYTATTACPISGWSVTNGLILGGGSPGDDTVTVQWLNGPVGVLQYTQQPCSPNTCPLPAVFPIPVIDDLPEIEGPESVCINERSVYRIEAFAGTDYNWKVSGGGSIIDGQGTNLITIQWGGFANPGQTRWVSVEYENCYLGCGGRDSIPVRILPSFVIEGPTGLCLGASDLFATRLVPSGGTLIANWRLLAPNGAVVWNSAVPSAVANVPFTAGTGLYRLLAVPANPADVCSTQSEWLIQVSAAPARPTAIEGPTMICPNTTFTYRATGVPPGSRIRWTIQNGPGAPTTALGNPLNVTWGAAGPYSLSAVQLSADELSCPSDTAFLAVMEVMPLNIAGGITHCTEVVGFFQVKEIPNIRYNWSIVPDDAGEFHGGVGTNGIRIYWQKPGTASVNLEVCGHVSSLPVTIFGKTPAQVNAPAGICAGGLDTITLDTVYSDAKWYNDQQVLVSDTTFLIAGPGSYTVFLIDAFGCPTSDEFTIAEYALPNVSVSTADPTGFCNNAQTVTMQALTDVGGNYTYEWFRDGVPLGVNSPVYVTNQYSTYTVQATNAFGCTAAAGPIMLFSFCGGPPVVAPSQGPPCPAGAVDFATNSTVRCDSFSFQLIPGPSIVPGSAIWQIGISGGPVLANASGNLVGLPFPNAGIYTVLMNVQLTNGANCTVVDSVRVEAVARFETTPACADSATAFFNSTTILPGTLVSGWDWDFGDPASGANNASTLQDPSHVFPVSATPFPVTLTVTAQSGCTSVYASDVLVPVPTPVPILPIYPRCTDLASPIPAGAGLDISEIFWDFGDPGSGANNNAYGQLVYHKYDTAGTYTIIARFTNIYGCISADTVDIFFSENNLTGDITPNNPGPICEGDTLTLTAPPAFVSGWSTNESGPSINVTESGTYSVQIANFDGCIHIPPPVVVNVTPQPSAIVKALQQNSLGQITGTVPSPLVACAGEDVILRVFGESGYAYTWSNGVSGPTVIFADVRNNALPVGTHTFTVTITDVASGCTSVSAPFTVIINPNPGAIAINATGVCSGQDNALSYTGPVQPDWVLTWNTGITGSTLITAQPGQYFLRVANGLGCSSESNRITVFSAPPVQTLPDGCLTQCRPDTLCVPSLPNIVSWQWYLDGSVLAGATQPELAPLVSGDYYAVLTDVRGCTAQSATINLTVLDGFGQLTGEVWSDVNNNGLIDPADTLVSGIPVLLFKNNVPLDTTASNVNGDFVFPNIAADTYTTLLSPALLPPGWNVLIGADTAGLVGCGASAAVQLLVSAFVCPPLGSTLAASACQGSAFTYQGVDVPAGQSQTFTFKTALGCDSLVTVQVTELSHSDTTLNAGACVGRSYTYEGVAIPAGQNQVFALKNRAGCDSLVTVSVAAWPNEAVALNVSACQGGVYLYNGIPVPAGSTQLFAFTTALGCDSTVTVNVSAIPPPSSDLEVVICPGTTYAYAGLELPAGETTAVTLRSAAGCDSLVAVSVDTFPGLTQTLNVSACAGDSYNHFGMPVPAGSVQIFQYTTPAGCDSVVTVAVDALAEPTDTLFASACTGYPFIYMGTPVPGGVTQDFVFKTVAGCDSTITVVVDERFPTVGTLDTVLCGADTLYYQGTPVPAGESAVFMLANLAGCDSTLTINVGAFAPQSSFLSAGVCAGDTFFYAGLVLLPGDTTAVVLTGANGCDSIVTVGVTEWPTGNFTLAADQPCPDAADGVIRIENLSGGTPPWMQTLNNGVFQNDTIFENLPAGAYVILLEDANGCTLTADTQLVDRLRLQLALPDAVLACDSNQVSLLPLVTGDTTGLSWRWFNGVQTPVTVATAPGPVWVEATNICQTVRADAQVQLEALEEGQGMLYAPNAFHPESSDALNGVFRVFFPASAEVQVFVLEVYDRWGNLVFRTEEFTDGWDGYFQEKMMDPAVFVWRVKAQIRFCGRIMDIDQFGDVTIVR
ncbi:MAG: PKD domain-containing protein [Saprospiraceae bacterium]|nr:PKD domain-containing protein [Saprospiraceae bacterium]